MKRSAIKRTSGLRRVSKKRAVQNRAYSKLRKAFLAAHPYCQVFLREGGHDERRAILFKGVLVEIPGSFGGIKAFITPPLSEEIHHVSKRRGAMLNDQSQWLAVSRKWHERIEQDKKWARARGYLADF